MDIVYRAAQSFGLKCCYNCSKILPWRKSICRHSTLDPNRVETACPRAVMHGGYYPRRGSIPFEIFMWSGGFASGSTIVL